MALNPSALTKCWSNLKKRIYLFLFRGQDYESIEYYSNET
jgi:hypothetical protein